MTARRGGDAARLTPDGATARADAFRGRFPALDQLVHGRPLVYLDNAATTQKPDSVLAAIEGFYRRDCSNVHRGLHELSARATAAFEGARETLCELLGARETREVVFTHGTTESINLVARAWGDTHVDEGDEIVVSEMEHHSNIVPWQMLCERQGATLRVVPIDDRGELRIDEYEALLGSRTKLVALTHISNALGTRNPVERIVASAHAAGALVLLDGAQAMAHERVDVGQLGCDFFACSGHKMYGPTGIGVLYGRAELLESLPPVYGGGEMIRTVSFDGTTYNDIPHRFEGGTPNIAGAIGLGAAARFLLDEDPRTLERDERPLLEYAVRALRAVPGLRLIGEPADRRGVVSFTIEGIHPHDLGTVLDHDGVAIRAGHHCAQPLMAHFGVPATVRASFACYNTADEVDALVAGLARAREVLGG